MPASVTGQTSKIGKLCTLLRADILGGRLKPGAPLPPQRELGKKHGMSEATAAAGLGRLVEEGLVIRVHGRGTFVAEKLPVRQKVLDLIRMQSRYTTHHNSAWELAWIEELSYAAKEAEWIPHWQHIRDREAANPRQLADELAGSSGVIIFSACPLALPVLLHERKVRVISVLPASPGPARYLQIVSNREDTVVVAMEHLTSLGHSKIGFVGLESSPQRLFAFLQFAHSHKLSVPGEYLINMKLDKDHPADNWDAEYTELLVRVLTSDNRPLAICCATENIAHRVVSTAADLGLDVPRDLAVVACNKGGVSLGKIGITTVDISRQETCRKAMELLAQERGTPWTELELARPPVLMPSHLTVRDSCGAKAARAVSDKTMDTAPRTAVYRQG